MAALAEQNARPRVLCLHGMHASTAAFLPEARALLGDLPVDCDGPDHDGMWWWPSLDHVRPDPRGALGWEKSAAALAPALDAHDAVLGFYFDSASLLAAGVVSRHWHSIATADQFWRVIVREDYSLDPACIDPPPRPVKALWLKMRRAFRSLLASDAAPPPACAQPLPVLPDRIVVH